MAVDGTPARGPHLPKHHGVTLDDAGKLHHLA
jgi:hypothetical protein